MKKQLVALFILLFLASIALAFETVEFKDPWSKPGVNINNASKSGLELTFSVGTYMLEEKLVDGKSAKAIKMNGCILPIGAGYPDLPVVSNYVAVPNGATPKITVLSYREEKYQNMDIAPGIEIPTDLDESIKPLQKNAEVYSKDEFFPGDFVMHSPVQKMRGVDVFIISFAPFRYNPVTRELVVRRDMKVSITFEGGKGVFGDDLYRHPLFERILQQNIINYSSLEPTRYAEIHEQIAATDPAKEAGQFEYIIIVPNDASFIAWAETLKLFRKKQGIKTGIFTTLETTNNPDSLEMFIDNAYNTWTTKPLAVLMMSDMASTSKAYGLTSSKYMLHPAGYPQYVSDNVFADLNITNAASTWSNGGAPELVFARMPAQTAAHCSTMVKKIINYETSPPSSATFYNLPLSAAGWQDERWFGMCSEICRGFFKNKLGKTTQQQYALVDASGPIGGDPWSTTDPSALVAAYGPAGENYIAATVPSGMVWNTGTGAGVVTAINNGTCLIMHRDHGMYSGWGEPAFTNTNIPSLTNTNLPFVFSMNCQTGAYQNASTTGGTFSEQFHRSKYGALGVMCATEVSYSFVNDALIMGIMDGMWPNFNSTNNWDVPNAGSGQTYDRYTEDLRPAFAMVSGKWHLMTQTYTDPAIPADYKEFTCHLFHVFGDPFMTFCSQLPDTFALTYSATIPTGSQTFNVNVKKKGTSTNVQGALVGLYMYVAAKDGSSKATDICTSKLTDASGNASFTINPANAGLLTVTATKSNFVRGNFTSTVSMLAVELTSFNAFTSGQGVTLNWQTASERNCLSWNVERSTSPENGFQTIGQLPGNGTTSNLSSYEFNDNSGLSDGIYYYRLVEIDLSGSKTIFGPVQANYQGSAMPREYMLGQSYPNPTTKGVTISYSLKEPGSTVLRIYNVTGQEVKTLVNGTQPAGSYFIPWDGRDNQGQPVSNGIYIYKLTSGDFTDARKMTVLK